jgi:iron complex outermembrane receptor protein
MKTVFKQSVITLAVTLASASAVGDVSSLLEEVMVTAQKKSTTEAAQDVPISISAYSGDKVEAMFAVNLTDVGLTAPNVNLTPLATSPGVANFTIRGMGTVSQSIPSSDPAVGVVMDGISYGTIFGVNTDLFDLESLEVLRGPQGTLFGRNVTGGAIVMRSTRPGEEFEGKIKATVGSHSRKDIMALVSGPLNDNWGAKLAVLSKDRDGLWDYDDSLNRSGRQGDAESLLIRPAIRYSNDSVEAILIAEYGDMEGEGAGTRNWEIDGVQIRDPYEASESTQGNIAESNLEWFNLMLETNWELWDGQLTTVLGYRDLEQQASSDIDGVFDQSRFEFGRGTGLDQEQTSLEVRWAGDVTDKISLTTGIYLFNQEYTYSERRFIVNAFDRRGVSTIEHATAGIFAQADYRLSNSLALTVGARYSQESKDAEIGVIGDPNAIGNCASQSGPPFDQSEVSLSDCVPALVDDESWSNFSPKIGLTWDVNEDVMAFASYSRGFRSGGYNVRFTDLSFVTPNPSSTPGPYNEEVVDAFELGIKSTLLDGRLRANLSLFHNQYDDLQRTALNANFTQEILNAATATIRGIEFDATYAVTDNLVLEASWGYLDPSYDEADFLTQTTGKSASSFDFTMVPENTRSAAATYDLALSDIGTLTWRLSYSFVDEMATDDFNRQRVSQYELYDASVKFTNSDENLTVSLFGRNLKDEVYFDFAFNLVGLRSAFLTPPRTYGVELTYEF